MGLGKKRASLQIHCPVDKLEGKNGLGGEVLFLLKEIGLLMPSGLSTPCCLLPEALLNSSPQERGEGVYPSFSQGGKLRH